MRLRWLTTALLVVATAAFVSGSLVERSRHHEAAPSHASTQPQAAAPSAGEGSGTHDESAEESAVANSGPAGSNESAVAVAKERGEGKVLGINIESLPLIATGAVVSLLLAVALVVVPGRIALRVTAVLALGFAVIEIGELAHQRSMGSALLVTLAGVALVSHLGSAATAMIAQG